MSALFIIGNGFDLAHNMPTKYSDFRKYIIERFPQSKKNCRKVVSLEYVLSHKKEEIAAEFLLFAMDNASGEDWLDFEGTMSKINFFDKWPKSHHKEDPDEDSQQAISHLLSMVEMNDYIFQAIQVWQIFLSDWIKTVERQLEIKYFSKSFGFDKIIKEKDAKFFVFNYTKTLQILYGVKKVIHIHNRIGQKLVFGHGQDGALYEEPAENGMFSSSTCDEMIEYLRKDTDGQLRKYKDEFNKLSNVDEVYSYGFSYSQVDSPYIKLIIKNISPNATWYFTKYEIEDTEGLRKKKVKLRRYGFKGNFDVYNN